MSHLTISESQFISRRLQYWYYLLIRRGVSAVQLFSKRLIEVWEFRLGRTAARGQC